MLQNLPVILFLRLICMNSGESASSCEYKAVGEKVVIELNSEEIKADDHLTWKHDQRKVFDKKNSKVKTKNEGFDADHFGSLILENIQTDKSGNYIGELFNNDGKLKSRTEKWLCVQEPVSEPTVAVECVEQGVSLSCNVTVNTGISVSWMKNGEKTDWTSAVLHINSDELKPGDSVSCTVSNMISQKSAKDVHPTCSSTGAEDSTNAVEDRGKGVDNSDKKNESKGASEAFLLGLDLWWILVIVTAVGALLLILFIICFICVCKRRRSKKKAEEEEEFRLARLMPDYSNLPDEQYMQNVQSERSSKSKRPLPPLPNDRAPDVQTH